MYSRRYSSISTINMMSTMVKSILSNFEYIVWTFEWMDSPTKSKAIEKLRGLKFLIGQPKEILNATLVDEYYSTLDISHDAFLESMLNVNRFKQRMQFWFQRKSNRETAWIEFADTAVSNAFHSASQNLVCK